MSVHPRAARAACGPFSNRSSVVTNQRARPLGECEVQRVERSEPEAGQLRGHASPAAALRADDDRRAPQPQACARRRSSRGLRSFSKSWAGERDEPNPSVPRPRREFAATASASRRTRSASRRRMDASSSRCRDRRRAPPCDRSPSAVRSRKSGFKHLARQGSGLTGIRRQPLGMLLARRPWRSASARWAMKRSEPGGSPLIPDSSEIDLRAEFHIPRLEHRVRPQPRRGGRRVGLVVGQHRVGVEDVEHIHADVGARPAESQVLGDSQVELIGAIAVQRARLDQVDGDRLAPTGEGASQRRIGRRSRCSWPPAAGPVRCGTSSPAGRRSSAPCSCRAPSRAAATCSRRTTGPRRRFPAGPP